MRAVFALLCDYALAHRDRKFYIVGGGITAVNVSRVPSEPVSLSLAVRVEALPEESGRPHTLRLQMLDPNGNRIIRTPDVILSPAASQDPITLGFVLNFAAVSFHVSGTHTLVLLQSDAELLRLPFNVVHRPVVGGAYPINDLQEIHRAFALFLEGDIAQSEAVTKSFLERYPTSGVAHNNLGFILLARAQPAAAVRELQAAKDNGFDRSDILAFNMGCARYLLGEVQEALALFRQCLSAEPFSGRSVLLGLTGDELTFAQPLASAGEYTSLVALNAGWSAASSDRQTAQTMYELAHYGYLAHRLQGDGFLSSLEALGERVRRFN